MVDGDEAKILSILPKIEITKFLEENQDQLSYLKKGTAGIKERIEGLDAIVDEIKSFYTKLNYNEIARKHFKNLNEQSKEAIYNEIFSKAFKLI